MLLQNACPHIPLPLPYLCRYKGSTLLQLWLSEARNCQCRGAMPLGWPFATTAFITTSMWPPTNPHEAAHSVNRSNNLKLRAEKSTRENQCMPLSAVLSSNRRHNEPRSANGACQVSHLSHSVQQCPKGAPAASQAPANPHHPPAASPHCSQPALKAMQHQITFHNTDLAKTVNKWC